MPAGAFAISPQSSTDSCTNIHLNGDPFAHRESYILLDTIKHPDFYPNANPNTANNLNFHGYPIIQSNPFTNLYHNLDTHPASDPISHGYPYSSASDSNVV